VPTRRRAMYRRRHAMLQALAATVDTLADTRHAVQAPTLESQELAADAADASTLALAA
jgi:hypothetical protein